MSRKVFLQRNKDLYPARLKRQISEFESMASEWRELHFALCKRGEWRRFKEVESLIRKHGIISKTIFSGAEQHRRLMWEYRLMVELLEVCIKHAQKVLKAKKAAA